MSDQKRKFWEKHICYKLETCKNMGTFDITNNISDFVPEWDKGLIRYFSIFYDQALGLNLHFWKPQTLSEGEDILFHPTLSSVFSRYWVMIKSQGVISRKN